MKYKILYDVDSFEWNNNLILCDYATFFQTAQFIKKNNPSKIPIFIYILDDSEKVLAQLGLLISKSQSGYSNKFSKKIIKSASKIGNRCSWVSGPIIHSKESHIRKKVLETIFLALDELIKKHNLIIIDGYSPPQDFYVDQIYFDEFKKNNFKKENFVTLVTDLNLSLENIWGKIKKNARNDVTKAERERIDILEITTKKELLEYRLLAQKWGKTKGIEITNLENIDSDWEYIENGIQKLFVAKKDNEYLAGLRIGCFNKIAYTHQVLNSYSKVGNVAGPLLTWNAIKWAKKNNMKIYDFSGGKAPPINETELEKYEKQWGTLFKYKRKWSGNEYSYYHFIKIINPQKYRIFRFLSYPDIIIRNYKKKHFRKPEKNQ